MIDRIRSFGDSFTFGTDLSDCDGTGDSTKASQLTWPALVSKELGLEYVTNSMGGTGNLVLVFGAMCLPQKTDFVMINWTYVDRLDNMDDFTTILPGDDTEKSNYYYKHIHSQRSDIMNNLCYIYSTHQYLKSRNIPFMSTIMDRLVLETDREHSATYNMQEDIKKDLTWFPGEQTFLEWSRSNNYPESEGCHPLEEAHARAAEIMLPIVESKINTYITTT